MLKWIKKLFPPSHPEIIILDDPEPKKCFQCGYFPIYSTSKWEICGLCKRAQQKVLDTLRLRSEIYLLTNCQECLNTTLKENEISMCPECAVNSENKRKLLCENPE